MLPSWTSPVPGFGPGSGKDPEPGPKPGFTQAHEDILAAGWGGESKKSKLP
jgi:hypothetical protein